MVYVLNLVLHTPAPLPGIDFLQHFHALLKGDVLIMQHRSQPLWIGV